jgi:antibiotic biosynthesis monooxygenase (ABM) superfamily enzyme
MLWGGIRLPGLVHHAPGVGPKTQNRVEKDCSLIPCPRMDKPIHIAITLRVRKTRVAEFERALSDFASRSLAEPGARGCNACIPPAGSDSTEYGIMRSFASAADRDAFYRTTLFKDWLARIEPMVEGEAARRQLDGLEAWFRDPKERMPPRWKMALLTWIAVWLASILMRAILAPVLGQNFPQVLSAGLVAAGVVAILTKQRIMGRQHTPRATLTNSRRSY